MFKRRCLTEGCLAKGCLTEGCLTEGCLAEGCFEGESIATSHGAVGVRMEGQCPCFWHSVHHFLGLTSLVSVAAALPITRPSKITTYVMPLVVPFERCWIYPSFRFDILHRGLNHNDFRSHRGHCSRPHSRRAQARKIRDCCVLLCVVFSTLFPCFVEKWRRQRGMEALCLVLVLAQAERYTTALTAIS